MTKHQLHGHDNAKNRFSHKRIVLKRQMVWLGRAELGRDLGRDAHLPMFLHTCYEKGTNNSLIMLC